MKEEWLVFRMEWLRQEYGREDIIPCFEFLSQFDYEFEAIEYAKNYTDQNNLKTLVIKGFTFNHTA